MLVTDRQRLREQVESLAARHGRNRSALLPILQAIQQQQAQISDYAMQVVADALDIHPVEVYSVVSFYSFLDHRPKGRFILRLCRTISCDMAGKDAVARQLESDLGIRFGETTADGRFTLEWANCLGLCDQGPALLVNDRAYTRVQPDQVEQILSACRRTFDVFAVEAKEGHRE
jgi:NADH-quinone oxidoreductase E subunit